MNYEELSGKFVWTDQMQLNLNGTLNYNNCVHWDICVINFGRLQPLEMPNKYIRITCVI